MSLTQRTHELIIEHFSSNAIDKQLAVDATCGNGHDTEFLAKHFAYVTSFDIQVGAIKATQDRLNHANLENVTLINDGHQNLNQHITSKLDCIMFNLGYLPNADKSITTSKTTTLEALGIALKLLKETGLISILCYPGHLQGAHETQAIQNWLNKLGHQWQVEEVLANHPSPKAPILYLLTFIH